MRKVQIVHHQRAPLPKSHIRLVAAPPAPLCTLVNLSLRVIEYLHQSVTTQSQGYDEESDHSNKAVRKTPEIESGHKVSEEVK